MNLNMFASKGKFSAGHFLQLSTVFASLMFWGKAFHNLGAVTGRDLPPQLSVVIITVR